MRGFIILFIFSIGTYALVYSVSETKKTLHLIFNSERAIGEVVELVKDESTTDNDPYMYCTKVRFKTASNYPITFIDACSYPNFWDVGDKVKVLYLSKQIQRSAQINTLWELWFGPIIVFLIGILHLYMALKLFDGGMVITGDGCM